MLDTKDCLYYEFLENFFWYWK